MDSSNDSSNSTGDFALAYAHGTVMVLAWMVFAPTGIFIARYGRFLHIGARRKLLGDTIWFQVHRLALSLAALATLLGFFLILVQNQGTWVDLIADGQILFAHSIIGVLIVCFATTQIWMALFRCHPNSKFRFIYNWVHRTTGLLAFVLSIPTIFLVVSWLPLYHNGLITILSLWTAWVVIAVVAFEFLQNRNKLLRKLTRNRRETRETSYEISGIDHQQNHAEVVEQEDLESDTINKAKLILLSVHAVVSIGLATSLIVLIWQQN
jgi:low affinity Fe/Cu permease